MKIRISTVHIVAGCFLVLFFQSIHAGTVTATEQPRSHPTKESPKPAAGPAVISNTTLPSARQLDCLIEPYLAVDVATSAVGVVKEVLVDRGQLLRKGDVLARLESEVEKANLAQARARVEFSVNKYGRMQELYKEQIVSRQQLEEAKSEHDLAQAELQKMTELFNQRTIESPLSGVVVERYVSPGEFVENKKIVRVAQIHPLNVEIIAPVSMLGDFKPGAKVLVFPENPVGGSLVARVKLIDRVIDAPSGTFRVRLDLPNPRFQIAAGVRCRAQLAEAGRS